jgi:hypothetical protein
MMICSILYGITWSSCIWDTGLKQRSGFVIETRMILQSLCK